MVKRLLNEEDIPMLNELLMGWNTLENSTVFEFNSLIQKQKWGVKEIKHVKSLVNAGVRPAMDVIFITWNSHPSYMKYIGKDVTPPPTVHMGKFQELIKEGKLNLPKKGEMPLVDVLPDTKPTMSPLSE